MFARATTRCWGLVLALGFVVPTIGAAGRQSGPAVPTPSPSTPAAPPVAPPASTPVTQAPAPGAPAPAVPAATPAPAATELWAHALDASLGIDLVLSDARLIVIAGEREDDGALSAHAAESGAEVWRRQERGWRQLAATDGALFALRGSSLLSIDPATGATRWELPDQDPDARMTVAGQWLIVAGRQETLAVNAQAGSVVWRRDLGEASTAPVVTGAIVILGRADGSLLAVDITSGTRRWEVPTGALPRALAASDAEVYATLSSGALCAYRAADGRNLWCFPLNIPAIGAPVVDGPYLHVALFDNSLYTFDRRSGVKRRQAEMGFRPAGGPQLAGAAVFVPLVAATWARAVPERMTVEHIVVPGQSLLTRLHRGVARPDGSLLVGLTVLPGEDVRLVAIRPADPPPPVTSPQR